MQLLLLLVVIKRKHLKQVQPQANISKIDLALLRDAATEALEWSGEELDRLVASGTLVEIEDDDDNEG